MDPAYTYRARCERVIDGDTYVLRVDLGFATEKGQPGVEIPIRARVHGADAPELTTPEGRDAKAFAMALMPPSEPLLVRSYKDERSFERWICDMWLADGRSIADVLVESGHAVRLTR
jgi:micrococcal nuclease